MLAASHENLGLGTNWLTERWVIAVILSAPTHAGTCDGKPGLAWDSNQEKP